MRKKWLLIPLVVGCVPVVYLGLDYVQFRIDASNFHAPKVLTVTALHPEFGEGSPAMVQGVRTTRDGHAQALAMVGACDAVTGSSVVERGDDLEIRVRSRSLPGDCRMSLESLWVPLPDLGPQGSSKTLVAITEDGSSVGPVKRWTCAAFAEDRAKVCAEDPPPPT